MLAAISSVLVSEGIIALFRLSLAAIMVCGMAVGKVRTAIILRELLGLTLILSVVAYVLQHGDAALTSAGMPYITLLGFVGIGLLLMVVRSIRYKNW